MKRLRQNLGGLRSPLIASSCGYQVCAPDDEADGDGVPDLWAVTSDGIARAYLISHLSATGPAEIEPQKPQKLS